MATVNGLTAFRDRNGNVYPIQAAPTYVDYRYFAAATAETHTVPAGAKFVIVFPSVDTYVNLTGTAVVPSADVTDGTGSIYVPAGYPRPFPVVAAGTFSVIPTAAAIVALEFYS